MGIEEFNDRLIYCNPYLNPIGWTSHFWGDYTQNKYDSPFVKLYENNKKRNAENDDFKKLFPALDLTTKVGKEIGKKVVEDPEKKFEKIPSNLTIEERKDYIKEHGGGLRLPEKKEDNSAAIVAGGCTILAGIAIAADCVFAKGKHIKQLTKCFKKTPKLNAKPKILKAKPVKTPKNKSVKSTPIIQGKQFSSVKEAEMHFRNMGIDADFSKCTDLQQLTHLDTELAKVKAMGINSQVKSITITPFDKKSMIRATNARGVECPENMCSGIYGMSDEGHIFLNSNGNGFIRMSNGSDVIKHEIGHYHRNVLKDNVYGAAEGANEVYVSTIRNISQKTGLSREQVLEKLTSKLSSEVKSYNPMADESFADMFSLMIDGKQYSKGAMLFYDMAGGARIPNKVINGMKYDDYICKLYEDAENILTNYIR